MTVLKKTTSKNQLQLLHAVIGILEILKIKTFSFSFHL